VYLILLLKEGYSVIYTQFLLDYAAAAAAAAAVQDTRLDYF
jgi:hypothetical protein